MTKSTNVSATSSRRDSVAALPPLDAAFLKLAVTPHRGALLAALAKVKFVASVHTELAVTGVPGTTSVALFAWPEPLGKTRRIAVDVVRLDGVVLPKAIQFAFELRPGERPVVRDELPPVVVHAGAADHTGEDGWCDRPRTLRVKGPEGVVVWHLVEAPGVEKEVQRVERSGAPVFTHVDTRVYCYRLTCGRCGRVRYSMPNSVHQLTLCRVCTRQDFLRRRALRQYVTRHGRGRRA